MLNCKEKNYSAKKSKLTYMGNSLLWSSSLPTHYVGKGDIAGAHVKTVEKQFYMSSILGLKSGHQHRDGVNKGDNIQRGL